MALVQAEDIQRMLAEIMELERRVQESSDRRGGGWRVYVEIRASLATLREAVTPDGSPAAALIQKAIPILEERQRALEAADAFNKISVQCSERSELDLVVLRKQLESEDPKIRLEAVAAAGELEWSEALEPLLAMLDTEDHPYVLSKLTKVIGALGGTAVEEKLTPFLTHEDPRVRANTVEGFESIPGESKFVHLMPLLEDPSARVKANALKALQALGGDKFTSLLRRMVESPEVDQRLSVLYALGAIRGGAAQRYLAQLMEDDHPEVRDRAVALTGRRGDLSAAQALVALVQTECGERTRSSAMKALGELRARAPRKLATQLDSMVQGVVGELGQLRGQEVAAAQDVETLLRQLAELSRPPPEPEPEPEPEPPPDASAEADTADEEDKAAQEAALQEEKIKKTLARMNAQLSALEPRERRAVEKMVRTGKVQNDSQLNREVARMRRKRRGG